MTTFDTDKQEKKLQELHEIEEERLVQMLAAKYQIPYANLRETSTNLDYLKLIPEGTAKEAQMAIFEGTGKKIQVGMRNPELPTAKNILNDLKEKNYQIESFFVSMPSLRRVWQRYKEIPQFEDLSKGFIDISSQRIEEYLTQTSTFEGLKNLFLKRVQSKEQRRVSELLEIMVSGAIGADASDIHMEPRDNNVLLRLRLDGVLHNILEFDSKAYQLLASRIKLISEMKLNIRDRAQDGRFTVKLKDSEIEIRSSSLPSPYGESIVLRILNPKAIGVNFEELGMQPAVHEIMEKEVQKPNGMILATGPTGSGKTTTLYAFLKKVKSPTIKIITIEEPIEYHLEGITQTQTNPKGDYTFTSGLRSILRQDPDVIMIGEIRDIETAQTAINAALTGHLVFTTLHTNDAAGTILRLIDLGVNPTTIAPAVNVSMAQRLVRKLCEKCKETYEPGEKEKETMEKILDTLPKNIQKPEIGKIKIFKAVGCKECNNIGYRGRIGIFEILLVDEEIENLILNKPSDAEIKKSSLRQKLPTIQQDAILKIINGTTSFQEAERVIEL